MEGLSTKLGGWSPGQETRMPTKGPTNQDQPWLLLNGKFCPSNSQGIPLPPSHATHGPRRFAFGGGGGSVFIPLTVTVIPCRRSRACPKLRSVLIYCSGFLPGNIQKLPALQGLL